ncbi:MAG TPA: hypothetical protein DCO86_05670 [Spirochaetaceae bacterium]|nr:hypothetical protein [Spirochaetaceae bacterium]
MADDSAPSVAGGGVMDMSAGAGSVNVMALKLNSFSLSKAGANALNSSSGNIAGILGIELEDWMEVELASQVHEGDSSIVLLVKVKDSFDMANVSAEQVSLTASLKRNGFLLRTDRRFLLTA